MAIFQDQPINLETIRGVSPERFVQRAERQQQAIVGDFLRMQQGIQAGIQEFEQKRAEKQNMQASLQLLKELGAVEGLSDESIKAGIKNAGGATNFLKTITDMETAAQQSRLLEAQIAAAGTPTEAKLTEAEREIRRVMEANPNLSYTDAVNIKEGVAKIVTNPVTGRTVIANLATGEEKPLTRSSVTDAAVSASLAPDEGASESSLNLYKIAETTTGIVPAIQAAAQRITGQVGIDVADPELLENIQTFQTAQSDIRRSMRTAPKFLASEMAMLDRELDIAPSAFKDPTTLLAQLRSVDKSIRNRLEGIAKSINDPNLPADEVAAGLRLQKDLINFLRNLKVPQVEQVDTEELYRQAGGTVDVSSIADKYLNQ